MRHITNFLFTCLLVVVVVLAFVPALVSLTFELVQLKRGKR